jgi:hypothetical protein
MSKRDGHLNTTNNADYKRKSACDKFFTSALTGKGSRPMLDTDRIHKRHDFISSLRGRRTI